MRIGQTAESTQSSQLAGTGHRGTTGAGALQEAAAIAATDRVELSTTSRKLATPAASIDSAQVQAVRKAIDSGTYVVDVNAVADKMISEAAELFERIVCGPR
jgi:negative regulator of flagellin synthesis FlgM